MNEPISRIRENLYLGDMFSATNESLLKELGITHLLNVADDVEERTYQSIESKKLNIHDGFINPNFQSEMNSSGILTWVETVLISQKGKLFVHCRAGINRSAAMVVAILMKIYLLPLKDAFREVETKRIIRILPINLQVLKKIDKELYYVRTMENVKGFFHTMLNNNNSSS
jgi:protein-tyrosine phosphatase